MMHLAIHIRVPDWLRLVSRRAQRKRQRPAQAGKIRRKSVAQSSFRKPE